jgi:polyphosphate kinase 2 (PPK2 family)
MNSAGKGKIIQSLSANQTHVEELSSLQQLHYASTRYKLLLIFQGMDAAGKDGAIRHVMSGVNPQGCEVFSFKQPTADELEHDFLWRTNRHLPERGRITECFKEHPDHILFASAPAVPKIQRRYSQGQSWHRKNFIELNLPAAS